MICESDLKEIKPELLKGTFSPLHIQSGVPIPKPTRVKFFSPEEWEAFTEEWASSLKGGVSKSMLALNESIVDIKEQ